MTRTAISPRFAIKMRGSEGVIIPRLESSAARRPHEVPMEQAPTLTEHTVARAALAAGFPGHDGSVRYTPATGSTNTDLLELAAAGAPEWTVLVAGHQRAGRGRLSRSWNAPAGSSLLVSVLLRPAGDPALAPTVSLTAAVAMADALREACGIDARCKWPNDLTARGRKLGGILAEARVENGLVTHLVVGTGVNVLQREQDLPDAAHVAATSVVLEGGRPDAAGLLAAYLRGLRELYGQPWSGAGGSGGDVLTRYRGLCETLGQRVRAVTSDGRAVEGVATGIRSGGELMVDVDGGPPSRVTFGEVVHLRPSGSG
jgi:BirA family biotin operon repressor/biotin-[acetyl-CoA-carboxylase] ligase